MLETGEGAGAIVESARPQADQRHRRDRRRDRQGARRQRRQGRRVQGGKEQLFGFFVGQTMKAMAGKANPQLVNERLRAKLVMTVPRRRPGPGGAHAPIASWLDRGLAGVQARCVTSSRRAAPCSATTRSHAPPKLLVVISVDQFSAEPVRRISAAVHRRACAAGERDGVPQRLSEPRRDRDLPRPFDDPDRRSSGAHRDHRQQLDRPVDPAAATRASIAPRTRRVPGTSSIAYKVSPKHLLVPTLGELMKARWPGSRNVAVAGKDRAAVMMSGHKPDQRWYWTGKPIRHRSCRRRRSRRWCQGERRSRALAWPPRAGPLEPPPFCQAKAREVPIEGGGKPVGAGRFARAAGDAGRVPRVARVRRRHAGARRGAGRRDAARPARAIPTCSRSACRRPIMSATPTAPKARRCASS